MTRQIGEWYRNEIKNFEGYGKRLPDGSCIAYQETINDKKDKWTIGYGCTRGVHEGLVWTKQQAEDKLLEELAIHERRVDLLITVPLTEAQFAVLVDVDYNCGALTYEDKDGNSHPTKLTLAVNAGDWARAERELARWIHFGGKPCKALIARRKSEIAWLHRPVEPVPTSYMPQAATEAPVPFGAGTLGAAGTTLGTAAGAAGAAVLGQAGTTLPGQPQGQPAAKFGASTSMPVQPSQGTASGAAVQKGLQAGQQAVEQGKAVQSLGVEVKGLLPKWTDPIAVSAIAILSVAVVLLLAPHFWRKQS
jgi:lysozyme